MTVSSAAERAFETIAARERDVLRAYTDGGVPQFDDVRVEPRVETSADPLSVAAPADAFFVATDERGQERYTRDGSLKYVNGSVCDRDGHPLLGYYDHAASPSPLRAEAVDVRLGLVGDLRIDADGAVSYAKTVVDPKTGARESRRILIGRIALARFPAASKLHQTGATQFAAPAGILPHLGRPGDGNFGLLRTRARERSEVDIDLGLERLQEAYVAFDALRAAHKAQGSVEKTSMDLLK